MPTVLVTGGCGFIGSNFIRHLLATDPAVRVVNFDCLTYAGNLANLADLAEQPALPLRQGRHHRPRRGPRSAMRRGVTDVIHFAAESHVDRSIQDSRAVRPHQRARHAGAARRRPRVRGERSTCRSRPTRCTAASGRPGSSPKRRRCTRTARTRRARPAADLLVQAYQHTFGLPAVITRCSNNYGPYQFPEKLIPLFITNLLQRRAGAGLRRRACRSATGFTSSTTAAASKRRGGRASPARSTTSAAGARSRTST